MSLIPFVDDSELFRDLPDITCLSQEFLDLNQGDDEEHAILLCNYFNYIDRSLGQQKTNENDVQGVNYVSYIVYGEAVPRGETWYVMRRDVANGAVELWDATTGVCYNFNHDYQGNVGKVRMADPLCPLKRIWSAVG